MVFLLAATGFHFYVLGYIYLSEVLLAGVFGYWALTTTRRDLIPGLAVAFVGFGLWILVLGFAVHNARVEDTLSFGAQYLIGGVILAALYSAVAERPTRLVAIFAGLSLAYLIMLLITGNPIRLTATSAWLQGGEFGLLFGTLAAATLAFRVSRLFAMAICFAAAGISIYNSDRSGALLLGCLGLWLMILPILAKARLSRPRPLQVVGIAVALVMAVVAINQLTIGAARMGLLPSEVSSKILYQANSAHGYFVAARPDTAVAFIAAMDRPIVGYGPTPRSWEARSLFAQITVVSSQSNDAVIRAMQRAGESIPLHSALAGSWVRGGLPGLLLWGYVIFQALACLTMAIRWNSPMAVIVVFSAAMVIYTVLMEPMTPRISWVPYMVAVLWFLSGTKVAPAPRPAVQERPAGVPALRVEDSTETRA